MRNSNHRNIPRKSMSESSDGLSDSDTGNDEDSEEDFSDEDHTFLISSVANLRRRAIMQLKQLQMKSKKTPKMKGRTLDINVNQPIISLEETKKIINDKLLQDERKIKIRNPKKHVISE